MPILGIIASQISGRLWAPYGAYDALSTVTVPSGGVASITFAAIPQGYKHLQIRALVGGSSVTSARMTFNSDTTTTNYSWHRLVGDGANASAAAVANGYRVFDLIGNSTAFMGGVVDILDYASTNKNKTVRSLHGVDSNATGFTGQVGMVSMAWYNSSTAVNALTITPDAGSFAQHSQFTLYGVR